MTLLLVNVLYLLFSFPLFDSLRLYLIGGPVHSAVRDDLPAAALDLPARISVVTCRGKAFKRRDFVSGQGRPGSMPAIISLVH